MCNMLVDSSICHSNGIFTKTLISHLTSYILLIFPTHKIYQDLDKYRIHLKSTSTDPENFWVREEGGGVRGSDGYLSLPVREGGHSHIYILW